MSQTSHYILFDSSCSLCTDVAAEIAQASGGALLGESLYARRAKAWLDQARPGWKFEPALIEVEGDEVRAYTGLAMRARMLTFLNPLQLLKIARIVSAAGVPLFTAPPAHEPHPELYQEEPATAALATDKPTVTIPSGFRMTPDGPDIGTPTPVATVITLTGQTIGLDHSDRNTLLLFLSTTCGYCRDVAAYVAEFARTAPERLILVFSVAEPAALREFIATHRLRDVPAVLSPETRSAFGVTGIPYAFALDGAGIIRAKGVVNNGEHLDSIANTFYIRLETFQHALARRGEQATVEIQ